MRAARKGRKGGGAEGRWNAIWVDHTVFKIEHEGDSIDEWDIQDFGRYMDSSIYEKFGHHPPRLTASMLNFSRNQMSDGAVRQLMEWLSGRSVWVLVLKLFRNSIGDPGAFAIGQYLANTAMPLHELHLSHNCVTEQGACAILESIAHSGHYPFHGDHSGRKDPKGLCPVWVRVEHNCIDWSPIEHRLERQALRYSTADSRDGWHPKDWAPMVCLHNSYRNQRPVGHSGDWDEGQWENQEDWTEQEGVQPEPVPVQGARDPRSVILAAVGQWPGGHAHDTAGPVQSPVRRGERSPTDQDAEEVPLFIFLDHGVVCDMVTMQEGVFSFKGLLNLAQSNHLKCQPVEHHESIHFVVTDTVIADLVEMEKVDSAMMPVVSRFMRSPPTSFKEQCEYWGFLEELSASRVEAQLQKVTPEFERRAQELRVSSRLLKMLDFAAHWQSASGAPRVFFITTNPTFCRLNAEIVASSPSSQWPTMLLLDDLNQRFREDMHHGGRRLYEVSHQANAEFCGFTLNASKFIEVAGRDPAPTPVAQQPPGMFNYGQSGSPPLGPAAAPTEQRPGYGHPGQAASHVPATPFSTFPSNVPVSPYGGPHLHVPPHVMATTLGPPGVGLRAPAPAMAYGGDLQQNAELETYRRTLQECRFIMYETSRALRPSLHLFAPPLVLAIQRQVDAMDGGVQQIDRVLRR